jgi:hypothetical protein
MGQSRIVIIALEEASGNWHIEYFTNSLFLSTAQTEGLGATVSNLIIILSILSSSLACMATG